MRICDLVLAVTKGSRPSDSEQGWAAQRPSSPGEHRSPSVLLQALLLPGVRGSRQELLVTKVRRTPAKGNKLFTVFKGEGVILSFPQAQPES